MLPLAIWLYILTQQGLHACEKRHVTNVTVFRSPPLHPAKKKGKRPQPFARYLAHSPFTLVPFPPAAQTLFFWQGL